MASNQVTQVRRPKRSLQGLGGLTQLATVCAVEAAQQLTHTPLSTLTILRNQDDNCQSYHTAVKPVMKLA